MSLLLSTAIIGCADSSGRSLMGFSGSQDRADESMLESHVGDRGNGLLFFRSNRSPGNTSHSRITSYHLSSIMWHSLVLAICSCAFVPGKRCFPQCPSAWPVSSYLNPPYLHSSFTMLLHNADTLRIDNQNGGRGCRASKLTILEYTGA